MGIEKLIENKGLMMGAEPFYFKADSDKAVLLIHGFTGTPNEMRELGRELHKNNITSLGVRLAGHSTNQKDLLKIKKDDWYNSAKEGLEELLKLYKEVHVVGYSMGGLLAYKLAYYYPEVKSIVSIATPAALRDEWLLKLTIPVVSKFKKYTVKHKKCEGVIHYESYPLNGVKELFKLEKEVKKLLPDITQPSLILQGKKDSAISKKSSDYFYFNLGKETDSQKLKILRYKFKNCDHGILRNKYIKKDVEDLIIRFINDELKQ